MQRLRTPARIIILVGTMTGAAELVAQEAEGASVAGGLEPEIRMMDDVASEGLADGSRLLYAVQPTATATARQRPGAKRDDAVEDARKAGSLVLQTIEHDLQGQILPRPPAVRR